MFLIGPELWHRSAGRAFLKILSCNERLPSTISFAAVKQNNMKTTIPCVIIVALLFATPAPASDGHLSFTADTSRISIAGGDFVVPGGDAWVMDATGAIVALSDEPAVFSAGNPVTGTLSFSFEQG